MLRKKIEKLIEEIVKKEVRLEHPANPEFGDYSTNIALQAKIDPKKIVGKLKDSQMFEKIEIAGPGFINFTLSNQCFQKELTEIIKQGDDYGQLDIGKSQKVQVEFISANPTGPLHIGNGRSAFFGDVLANILAKAGYQVEREYFINDAKKSTQIKELGKTALGQGTAYLSDYLKAKIKKLKPQLSRIKDEAEAGFLLAQEIQKDNQEFITQKLKIKFNRWFSEQELYEQNKIKEIFKWLQERDLTYKKEGAVWLKTSQYGDSQDWVLIRADGQPTYLLSDIAYHQDKFNRGYDKIINIWGADHQGHVRKIQAVKKILGYQGDLDVLITQIVRLKSGQKLSKRKGQMITLKCLVDETGLDVARFLYLMKSLDAQMEFDLDLAKEQSEKNPVYYVQYAHARICSILRKVEKNGNLVLVGNQSLSKDKVPKLTHSSELDLIRQLIKFPEVIADTSGDYQVQRLPHYALELATAFHKFYKNCRVLSDDEQLTQARLFLIKATQIVLRNVLGLMNLKAPEKM
jgi:arginyl-tRNA synthetase